MAGMGIWMLMRKRVLSKRFILSFYVVLYIFECTEKKTKK
jgi:hypothetical protein